MRRALIVAAVTAGLVVGPAIAASAHPLGNFTVNHYDGLTVRATGVDVLAVVDTAEIPTAQAQAGVDTDGDGRLSDAERSAFAARTCAGVSRALALTVAGRPESLGELRPATY